MPGIHVLFGLNGISSKKVSGSLGKLIHQNKYKSIQFCQNDGIVIAFSGYEGYPLHRYEDKNVLFLLEGLIYDKTDQEIDDFIRKITAEYYKKKNYKRRIVKLIEHSDGDFIGLIYFKNEKVLIIFGDRYGRLPAFYFAEDQLFAFSREIKFLLNWISSITFNKIAMAEFLSYHFNLGDKTLIRGIKRLEPAEILKVNFSKDSVLLRQEPLLSLNFETKELKLTRNEIIKQLVILYREALSVRVKRIQEKGLHIVADISGGYDSRAIFGELCQMGVVFTPCTDKWNRGNESHIAKQLSDLYNKNLVQTSSSSPVEDFLELRKIVYLTDCMVNGLTALSSFYINLEREKLFSEKTVRFMGFGGEFIRNPFKLKKYYPNLIAMLEDAAYSHYIPPSFALDITKVNPHEFRKSLEHEVSQFLENSAEDKVKNLYFQLHNKLVSGGEDRHRMFSWTVQPLWGKNLFEFEMTKIPPKMISFGFFIDFLRELDHQLLRIPINGSRLRFDSRIQLTLHVTIKNLREYLSANRYLTNLYKWIDRKFHKCPIEFSCLDEIQKLCENKYVSKNFNIKAIEEFILKSPRSYEVYQLLTLMIYVDEVGRRFGQKVKC